MSWSDRNITVNEVRNRRGSKSVDGNEDQNKECARYVGIQWQPVNRCEVWHHMVRVARQVNNLEMGSPGQQNVLVKLSGKGFPKFSTIIEKYLFLLALLL